MKSAFATPAFCIQQFIQRRVQPRDGGRQYAIAATGGTIQLLKRHFAMKDEKSGSRDQVGWRDMTSEVNGRASLIVCQKMELAMFDFDLSTLRLTISTSKSCRGEGRPTNFRSITGA